MDAFRTKRGCRRLEGLVTEFAWPAEPAGSSLMHLISYRMREL
jgi:hypothetical protein